MPIPRLTARMRRTKRRGWGAKVDGGGRWHERSRGCFLFFPSVLYNTGNVLVLRAAT
jgi:hypothetical protein